MFNNNRYMIDTFNLQGVSILIKLDKKTGESWYLKTSINPAWTPITTNKRT